MNLFAKKQWLLRIRQELMEEMELGSRQTSVESDGWGDRLA
jgi:hypothetical protein